MPFQRGFMMKLEMKLLQLILLMTFCCTLIDCKEKLDLGEKSKILSKLEKIKDGGREEIEFSVSDKVSISQTSFWGDCGRKLECFTTKILFFFICKTV